MKALIRTTARALTANDLLWALARTFGLARNKRLAHARATTVRQRLIRSLGTPCRVPSGPFAGMIFPDLTDRGGGWMPRVLGTYENELAEALECAIRTGPALVIDVGCAEGYYAVGLALRIAGARVDAYDIVESERALCARMAEANGVADRVFVKSRCTEQTLLNADPATRCLVLCDCEGAELDLITGDVARHLEKSWFVVECHDFLHRGATERISATLTSTHECRIISSTSDEEKSRTYHVNAHADDECPEVRAYIYGEGRQCIMHWVVASPRS